MSRSRRKTAVLKVGMPGAKTVYNRKYRRALNVAVNQEKDPLPTRRQVTDQYTICDYWLRFDPKDPKYTKYLRK